MCIDFIIVLLRVSAAPFGIQYILVPSTFLCHMTNGACVLCSFHLAVKTVQLTVIFLKMNFVFQLVQGQWRTSKMNR